MQKVDGIESWFFDGAFLHQRGNPLILVIMSQIPQVAPNNSNPNSKRTAVAQSAKDAKRNARNERIQRLLSHNNTSTGVSPLDDAAMQSDLLESGDNVVLNDKLLDISIFMNTFEFRLILRRSRSIPIQLALFQNLML